jgi:hypothetical protein
VLLLFLLYKLFIYAPTWITLNIVCYLLTVAPSFLRQRMEREMEDKRHGAKYTTACKHNCHIMWFKYKSGLDIIWFAWEKCLCVNDSVKKRTREMDFFILGNTPNSGLFLFNSSIEFNEQVAYKMFHFTPWKKRLKRRSFYNWEFVRLGFEPFPWVYNDIITSRQSDHGWRRLLCRTNCLSCV